jgi:hypothetical protein
VSRAHGIHDYRSAEKNGERLTLHDAAAKLGVSHHEVRNSSKSVFSTASRPCPAHRTSSVSDLKEKTIADPFERIGPPCRVDPENQFPMFRGT